jgi:hypothetical protein
MQLHPTDYTPALLCACIAKLPEGQQDFAHSLLSSWQGRGLSEKQRVWVMRLIDKAQGHGPQAAQVGNVGAIVSLIRGAGRNLKRPSLLLATEGPDTLRITIAGPASREPGALNVTTTTKGPDGRYGWIGRISTTGVFTPGQSLTPNAVANVTKALVAFAADPAGVAAAYGKRTGACCFCARRLTDGVSVAMGYGEICSENWGVPYGKQAAAALQCEAA